MSNPLTNDEIKLRLSAGWSQSDAESLPRTEPDMPDWRTSRFRGVSYHKTHRLWSARITHENVVHELGYFKDEITAAIIYNTASKQYHGPDAQLNTV